MRFMFGTDLVWRFKTFGPLGLGVFRMGEWLVLEHLNGVDYG